MRIFGVLIISDHDAHKKWNWFRFFTSEACGISSLFITAYVFLAALPDNTGNHAVYCLSLFIDISNNIGNGITLHYVPNTATIVRDCLQAVC